MYPSQVQNNAATQQSQYATPQVAQQVQYANPQFQAASNILDYSFNILNPVSVDERNQIKQAFGPNATSLPAEGKNLVLQDFAECLNIDPATVQEWSRKKANLFRNVKRSCCLVFIIFVAVAVITASGVLGGTPMVGALVMAGCVVGICISICAGVRWMKRTQKVSDEMQVGWQSKILTELKQKMNGWKARYPALTFTIIFPRVEKSIRSTGTGNSRGVRNVTTAKWCHIRVTIGPCPTTQLEPVIATTYDVNGAPAQQQPMMIPVQQQQQQPLMQQQQQLMVNGQVATTAVINGQQVMIVPMQQQAPVQQMQMHQQMQQIPQSSGDEGPPAYTHQ
eukprot:855735_1